MDGIATNVKHLGQVFWHFFRFLDDSARPGLVAGANGRFQAEIAADRLIRDDFGADRGRRRVAATESVRWLTPSLG
jgi:hypothetical protein